MSSREGIALFRKSREFEELVSVSAESALLPYVLLAQNAGSVFRARPWAVVSRIVLVQAIFWGFYYVTTFRLGLLPREPLFAVAVAALSVVCTAIMLALVVSMNEALWTVGVGRLTKLKERQRVLMRAYDEKRKAGRGRPER